MKTKLLILSIATLCLSAAPGFAAPFNDGGASLEGALNTITLLPNPSDTSVDVVNDMLTDNLDSSWNITATGGSVATVIIEIASYAGSNTFGVYDPINPSTKVQIFDGAATTATQATLSIWGDGSVFVNHVDTTVDFAVTYFGYYLDATIGNNNNQAIFHSDTAFNLDGQDHMYAYQGTNTDTVKIGGWPSGLWTNNEYVLAFEDLWNGGDRDFSDFVVMVESVQPIPVPGAVLLGILGLSAAGIKLRRFA